MGARRFSVKFSMGAKGMARAHAASACVQSDSIKGLAQSIAKPAYHRLLVAEPALRRAVPTLIIAFLITICLGAFVQVVAAAGSMHGTQIDNGGGLFGSVAIDAIVQRQEVAIELGQRIGCINVKRHFQVIGLADIPDIRGIPDRHAHAADVLLRHQPRT